MQKQIVLFKLLLCLLFIIMIKTNSYAQTGLNFQGVARSSNNVIIASQQISLRLSILQGTATGSVEYSETRKVTTNAQGLFAVVIGDADAINSMGSFTTINWKNTPKFLKIEMDANAGNNYTTIGTTQFQYVAYAQFASSVDAENIAGIVPVNKGGTGVSSITALRTSLALDKINNTADADKPISTKTQAALDLISVTASDTSRFSSRINAKANTVDVNTSLALKANSSDVATSLTIKLNKTDTSYLLQKADTISLSNRIDLKANISDVNTSIALKANTIDVTTSLSTKVDKVTGKNLSTNDYSTAEKTKLAAITGANTGDQDLSSYATNTSLALKANTTDVTTILATKVDKVTGKVLSTNDYTTAEKTKLAAITGANTGDQDLSSYATNTALALKANTTDVTTGLGLKANALDVSTNLATKANVSDVNTGLATKVDKVTGKNLSSNDYTTAEKTKLAAITGTNTGDQDLSSYANNTALALKANTTDVTTGLGLKANALDVSTNLATKASTLDLTTGLATKVDKLTGKNLSTNDYTNAEKTKLAAITGTNTGDQDLSSYATNTSLALKANTSDMNTSLALKASISDVTTSLDSKENISNKSTATDLGGVSPSDVLFPTQKAVKDYVSANAGSGGVADGGITNIKLADGAVTYAKFQSIPTNTILGNTTSSTAIVQAIATTGSDNVVLSTSPTITSPTLITPNIGAASATSINDVIINGFNFKSDVPSINITGITTLLGNNTGDDATNSKYEGLLTSGAVDLINDQAIDGKKTFLNNITMANLLGVGSITPTTINFANGSKIGDIQNINENNPDVDGSIDLFAPDGAKWVKMNYGNTNSFWIDQLTARIDIGDKYWEFKKDGSSWFPGTLKLGSTIFTKEPGTNGYVLTYNNGNAVWQASTGTSVSDNIDASTLSGTTLKSTITGSSLTSVGTLANLTVTNAIAGSITGNAATSTLATNATTATKLATARTINGVAFDGSGDINITASLDAGTLTGTTLNATVTGSSLTSVGTLANLTVTNAIAGSITGNAATSTLATNATTATTAGNITATSNTTLTSLSNLATVGTITSGVWNGTAVAIANGGTGATTADAARTNLGLVIGTNVQAPNASITGATKTKLTYDVKGLVTAGADATTADIAASTNKNYVTDAQSGVLSNTTGTNTGDQVLPTLVSLGAVASNASITGATKTKLTYDVKGLVTAGSDATTADIAASTNKNYVTDAQSGVLSNTTGTNTGDQVLPTLVSLGAVGSNASITGATKTKLTYDVKGLVTAGADATTADIAASTNKNYVTDAQSGVLSNTTGTNTGDETASTIKIKLAITTLSGTNTGDQTITLTGDVTGTGSGTFTSTLANSGVSANTYGSSTSIPTFTVDAKGRVTTASTASIVADAGTLTGTILNATVTGSSLTSVGTITSGVWSGTAVAVEKGGTGLTAAGTNGQVLTSTGSGTLTWTTPVFLPTVVIGTQQWMEKNLDVMTYRNGDIIPQVTSATEWAALTTGAWCWYDNSAANGAIYGKLYNWYAVNDARGLAPQGWHIPTDAEWTTLSTKLGGTAAAGGKMKTTGITRWATPNTSATNESGFAGLPGGLRYDDGAFADVGLHGLWWIATQFSSSDAWYRYLYYNVGGFYRINYLKTSGLSVRCLRD